MAESFRPYGQRPHTPLNQGAYSVGPSANGGFDTIGIAKALRDLFPGGDDTPDEKIEQGDAGLRQRGLRDQEIASTYLDTAKTEATKSYIQRRAEAAKRYTDANERAKAEAEAETGTQFFFRALGDLAGAVKGGDPNALSKRIQELRRQRQKDAQSAARDAYELELGGIEAEQADERLGQQRTLFDQGQEDRTRELEGRKGLADVIRGQLEQAGALPPGLETNPDALIAYFEKVATPAMKAAAAAQAKKDAQAEEEARYQRRRGDAIADHHAKAQNTAEFRPEKPPAQNMSQAATFGRRMVEAERALTASGYNPTASTSRLDSRLPGEMQSSKAQSYLAAKRAWINSNLRDESGATIQPHEFDSADKQYFPQPGEGPEIVEQKRRMRESAVAGLRAEAGRAWPTNLDQGEGGQGGGAIWYSVPGHGRIQVSPDEEQELLREFPNAKRVQ